MRKRDDLYILFKIPQFWGTGYKCVCCYVLVAFLICFCLSVSVTDATMEFLIDGSGSMRGFFSEGSIQSLIDRLSRTASEGGIPYQITVFISKRERSGEFQHTRMDYEEFLSQFQSQQNPFGSHTLLDIAFEKRDPFADILFLITDNVVHSGTEPQGNTEKFYRQFNDPSVKRIYILPQLLDFRGRVYYDKVLFTNFETFKRELIDANGVEKFYGTMFQSAPSSYVAYYNGKRGLIIYAIQLSDASTETYRRILKGLYQQYDWEKEVLLIKPIDQSQIRVWEVDDITRVRKAIFQQQSKLNPKQPVRVYPPNMKLHLSSEDNYLVPYDINNPPLFQLNSENLIRFYFSLSSKLNHVNIGKPDITGKTDVKISISNLSFRFLNSTDEGMVERRFQRGRVIPPHLVGTLSVEQDIAPTKQYYYMSEIKFGPCPIKWSLGVFWTLIWMRSIPVRMDFNIHLLVPPNQLALAESFQSKYFTNNLNVIDSIYSPQDLIEYLSKEPIHINIPVKCK